MPFRKIKMKDPKTNEDILDDEGNPIFEDEKFLHGFLGHTKEDGEALYKKYEKVLTGLANKYAVHNHVDAEDVLQEGIIGLARAIRDFDAERSADFNTFALYKIKDAMREFILKQSSNVRVPHYIKETTRLIAILSKLINKLSPNRKTGYLSIWKESSKFEDNSEIIEDIKSVRTNLINLANRSCTTVNQLLKRAELYPADIPHESIETYDAEDPSNIMIKAVEENIISYIMAKNSINKLKKLLSEDDFNLLYLYYVEGLTMRQLEPIFNVTSSAITTRLQNILKTLHNKKDYILPP